MSLKHYKRKKVLIVPSWYPTLEDRVSGVFIREQAITLAAEYDVAVLIPKMARWRDLLSTSREELSVRTEDNGVVVYREFARPVIPHGPESISYQTFVRAAQRGYRRLLKEWGRPDIIHAHVVLPGGWAALKLAKQYGIPVVLTEHSGPFSMHLTTPLQQNLVRQILSDVDRVLVNSPALLDQITTFYGETKPQLLGELVRTDFFVPGLNGRLNGREVTRFLFIGRLSEEKGVEHLIKAAHQLQQQGVTSFELVLGGDGPERGKLEKLVDDLGVRSKCKFLGSLNREEVRRQMQSCDVFILPSLLETFGIVVGEAMACGKPVIATRCGGPEFIVTDETGLLVNVADPSALADAMSKFASGRVSFDTATVRASVVNRFGAEAFLRNMSDVYAELW